MASCISVFISCANYSIIPFNYVYCVSRTSCIRDDARRRLNYARAKGYCKAWLRYFYFTANVPDVALLVDIIILHITIRKT